MTVNAGMLSSKTSEWGTPQELFDKLHARYHFTLDPCASEWNHKCEKYYTKEDGSKGDGGLSKWWRGERVFMNPPYGREIGRWVRKAHDEVSLRGCIMAVCLVPARTDTRWWHEHVEHGDYTFIKGRLHFIREDGSSGPAPFPSALVMFPRAHPDTQSRALTLIRAWEL